MEKIENILKKFNSLESELQSFFFERDDEIRGLLCAVLSNEHLLLVGVPGTAKSLLARTLCNALHMKFFQWLLTKFTTPEEIFGSISLKALEQGKYQRITKNKLPECNIALIEEVFYANSSILNALNTIMNERLFFNDSLATTVPLISVIGTTNIIPEEKELQAFYDRFLLRFVVNYIVEDASFVKMMKANILDTKTSMKFEELKLAQDKVVKIDISSIIDHLLIIRNKLKEKSIIVSDRRFKQSIKVLQAHAFLNGHKAVETSDLNILKHVYWTNQNEMKEIELIILSIANPYEKELLILREQYDSIIEEIDPNMNNTQKVAVGSEIISKLNDLKVKTTKFGDEAKTMNYSNKNFITFEKLIEEKTKSILSEFLGVKI